MGEIGTDPVIFSLHEIDKSHVFPLPFPKKVSILTLQSHEPSLTCVVNR